MIENRIITEGEGVNRIAKTINKFCKDICLFHGKNGIDKEYLKKDLELFNSNELIYFIGYLYLYSDIYFISDKEKNRFMNIIKKRI